MKTSLTSLMAALAALLLAASCSKERQTLYDGPNYIMFSDTLYTFGVLDSEEYFEIPLCAARPSARDRNVGVEVLVSAGDAIYGYQFALESTTVVIPAGSLRTSVRLRAWPDRLKINEDVSAILRLVLPNDSISELYGTDTRVQLHHCCPYSRDSFVGYMAVSSSYAMSYLPDYRRLVRAEADMNDPDGLILKDFMYDGYDIKIHLDPGDRLNPLVRFDEQVFAGTDVAFGTKYGDGLIRMVQPHGYVSYYSTCENFIALYTTLYVADVGTVGTFANVCERISDAEAEKIKNVGF